MIQSKIERFIKLFYELKVNRNKPLMLLFLNIFFSGLYLIIAIESLSLATVAKNVSPVWPPTGFAIFILIIMGQKFWPSIFLGALVANYKTGLPLTPTFLIAVGNTLEALSGYFIYLLFLKYKKHFEQLTPVLALITISLFAPVVSATVGVSALLSFNIIKQSSFANLWLTWWVGDVSGALLIVPLALLIREKEHYKIFSCIKNCTKTTFSILVLSILAIYGNYLMFLNNNSLKYLFLVFPSILLFSFLKNRISLYLATVALCSSVIYVTINGYGPFNLSSFNQNLLNLEVFISSVMVTSFFLIYYHSNKFVNTFRVLLLAGWFFWGVIFFNIQNDHQKQDQEKFDIVTSNLIKKIEDRMNDYIFALNNGVGLFRASDDVTAREWKTFYNNLNLLEMYQGINGIGVINKVEDSSKVLFEKKYQAQLGADFKVKTVPTGYGNVTVSDNPQKDHYVITYVEPLEKNQQAIGLDVASEAHRKEAADKSIVTGKAAMTSRIVLVQDNTKRNGFLLYVPVYTQDKNTIQKVDYVKKFSHWIYAPFITDNFFNEIIKNENLDYKFTIYEDENLAQDSEIYESSKAEVNENYSSSSYSFEIAQKKLWIKWEVKKSFAAAQDFMSTWIGFIGAFSVLIFAAFIVNTLQVQDKAQIIAEKLNNDYRDSLNLLKIQEAKMAESSKMASLGEMASGVAHEINNPLSIISLSSYQLETILNRTGEFNNKDKAIIAAQKIIKTVDRISRIIKGLRLFARDANADPMRNATLENIIDDTLVLCQERFKHANIKLNVNLEYKGEIFCRDTQISQVLLNLLNNSYDAIENSKEKWVEIKAEEKRSKIFLTVTDSGSGIPLTIQEKILQPFFTTKGVGKGTGLGLSISKGIIESHGGEFYIDNQCKNTRFVMVFNKPVAAEESDFYLKVS